MRGWEALTASSCELLLLTLCTLICGVNNPHALCLRNVALCLLMVCRGRSRGLLQCVNRTHVRHSLVYSRVRANISCMRDLFNFCLLLQEELQQFYNNLMAQANMLLPDQHHMLVSGPT